MIFMACAGYVTGWLSYGVVAFRLMVRKARKEPGWDFLHTRLSKSLQDGNMPQFRERAAGVALGWGTLWFILTPLIAVFGAGYGAITGLRFLITRATPATPHEILGAARKDLREGGGGS